MDEAETMCTGGAPRRFDVRAETEQRAPVPTSRTTIRRLPRRPDPTRG